MSTPWTSTRDMITLKLNTEPFNFAFFLENQNGSAKTAKGGLKNQNTSTKDVAFDIQSSFYINDSFFVFQNRNELHNAVGALNNPFLRFGLKMHL